jgi:phosphohistidine phosphatase
MDLYILRHGIAEENNPDAPANDSRRRLTSEGAKKIQRIAKGMKALELDFDLILSSPYVRARETAALVAKEFGAEKKLSLVEALVPDGNPKDLVDQLKSVPKKNRHILLVGHEPYLSRFISLLISGDTCLPITLKKGGLCKLSLKSIQYGRCATLEWLLTPGQNRRIS